jgi:uncharacterized protein (UPF0335 family)
MNYIRKIQEDLSQFIERIEYVDENKIHFIDMILGNKILIENLSL